MPSTAIVLHGPTSAGKSSLARALQATAPSPAFHISLDAFVCMSNRRDMRSDAERAEAYKLHCENLRSTLARVVQTHFDIIVDLVLRDEAEFQACLKAVSSRTTYLIGVTAPLEVLETRERLRDNRARNCKGAGGRSGVPAQIRFGIGYIEGEPGNGRGCDAGVDERASASNISIQRTAFGGR